MVHLVLMELPAHPEPLEQQGQQASQVHKVLLVPQEQQAQLDLQVLQDQQASLEVKVFRDSRALQVQLDQQDRVELQGPRELVELQGQEAYLVLKDQLDLQELQALQVILELLELLEQAGHPEQ